MMPSFLRIYDMKKQRVGWFILGVLLLCMLSPVAQASSFSLRKETATAKFAPLSNHTQNQWLWSDFDCENDDDTESCQTPCWFVSTSVFKASTPSYFVGKNKPTSSFPPFPYAKLCRLFIWHCVFRL